MSLDANWITAISTSILVTITGIYAYLTNKILKEMKHQSKTQANALSVQNQLLHSQVLNQRFETYWKTYAPITDEELREIALTPEDWMNPKHFEEKYKNDKKALRRYLLLARRYEYLAFMSTMEKSEIPDPLGYEWTKQWVRDLSTRKEFLEINEWYRPYYRKFSRFVDSLQKKNASAKSLTAGEAHKITST